MTKKEFETLLKTYGSNVTLWPEDLQALAKHLFKQYPEIVKTEQKIDKLLSKYKVKDLSVGFCEVVLNLANLPSNDNIPVKSQFYWKKMAIILVFAIIGFWCGASDIKLKGSSFQNDNMKTMLFGTTKLKEVIL